MKNDDNDVDAVASPDSSPLKITIPVMPASTRRSNRLQSDSRSGSHISDPPYNNDDADEDEAPVRLTKRGRTVKGVNYAESSDADGEPDLEFQQSQRASRSKRRAHSDPAGMFEDDEDIEHVPRNDHPEEDDDDEDHGPRRSSRSRLKREESNLRGFIIDDEPGPRTRLRSRPQPPKPNPAQQRSQRAQRRELSKRGGAKVDDDYRGDSSPHSQSSYISHETNEADIIDEVEELNDDDEPEEEKGYKLRERPRVNYTIPPPLEEMHVPPKATGNKRKPPRRKGPGWSAGGAELGRWMGLAGDDSDSDAPTRTPKKPMGMGAFDGGVAAGGSGLLPPDFAATGTPSNLGKVTDASLADADPLGVNVNVTFDEVGGLDDHIHSLKEMTLLPLLYPEVFQQFHVTPPRGVLFHGPPGTGKTLLARALAASCRSNGKQISFFMRKGADALSKWVGEAERQLRLLFEEARNSQPSIIFFDEIDGLAPVRSSKQDQIHASIVSTLLALMDGMDGRGQVIVIGATNRPDSIDPALRRPGRFDREFYFPLPKLEAREKILGIMTKEWQGWTGNEGQAKLHGLAKMTKGYGGADLRALCTEAALNAVQRKYPQIYQSNERLLLKPDSISVGLRDFMISIKKMVPSSARSSASVATPLPPQFEPILADTLENAKTVLQRVLPMEKRLTALEEAEYEDEDNEEVALDRELLMQSMETLRVHRPRVLLYGAAGMGQTYVGAALLHHLEGYSVQSLELGTLLGDATRTVEAAIVQLFVEAKRHQPSIVFIPSLIAWSASVSDTARATVKAMLDTLAPTDPVLLLAIIEGQLKDLPRDVRAWFGPGKDNRVELAAPSVELRAKFFEGLLKDVQRPPNHFLDGIKRKKRVLEQLPIAPPLEPRKPTAAETAAQAQNDQRLITLLKFRLGPILTELKKKFKRFTKRATEEYAFDEVPFVPTVQTVTITEVQMEEDGPVEVVANEQTTQPLVNGHIDGTAPQVQQQAQAQIALPQLYDMDLERMHAELYKDRYLTPQQFLDDVGKIVYNAEVHARADRERLLRAQAMFTAAEVSIQEFDAPFRLECERMSVREKARRVEMKQAMGVDKGKDKPEVIRRSARQPGQHIELAMTDPVQLERTLKRQRPNGEGTDNASDQDGRDIKRSKILAEVDGDADADGEDDPLDIIGRPTVHFADEELVRTDGRGDIFRPAFSNDYPMSNGLPTTNGFSMNEDNSHGDSRVHGQSPNPYYNGPPLGEQQPHSSDVNSLLNHDSRYAPFHHQPQHTIPQPNDTVHHNSYLPTANHFPSQPYPGYEDSQWPVTGSSNIAVYDQHPQAGPSHADLTYGAHPTIDGRHHSQPQLQLFHRPEQLPAIHPHGHRQPQIIDPSLVTPPILQDELENPFVDHIETAVPTQPDDPPTSSKMAVDEPDVALKSKSPESASPPKDPTPPPPIIERTPTPLPDFHCDEMMLSELRQDLRDLTGSLNVEQLEQLRATCLSAVWRRRTEWDRADLIRELQALVKEFVSEVGEDQFDSDGDGM